MKKISLNDFVSIKDAQIRNKEEIQSILDGMWNLPFGKLFHSCWKDNESYPSGYIRDCLTDKGIIPEDTSIDELKYGEVSLLIKEEYDEIPDDKKRTDFDNILIQLGRIYHSDGMW